MAWFRAEGGDAMGWGGGRGMAGEGEGGVLVQWKENGRKDDLID